MNIRKLIREEIDDLEWIRDIEPNISDLVLNKAFHFDVEGERFNNELYTNSYNKLVKNLMEAGFEPKYNTPIETNRTRFQISGLYVYREARTGDLYFVYTTPDYDTTSKKDYEDHIKQYAKYNSTGIPTVVDAIDFIETYL